MKYFEYIALAGFFITAVAVTFYFCRQLKIYHFYRLIRKAYLKKTAPDCGENYLPAYYLRRIAAKLIKAKAKRPLVYLCAARGKPAVRWLEKHNDPFSA